MKKKWQTYVWIALLGVGGVSTTAVGYTVGGERGVAADEIVFPDYAQDFLSLRNQLETLTARSPEVQTVVTTRIIRDTLRIPYPVVESRIISVTDTVHVLVMQIDTVWAPPQIITIPAPERGFWAAESYQPSIGTFVWSAASLSLGAFLQSVFSSSARACVVVNGEESCNY